jgi:hypothetical protein
LRIQDRDEEMKEDNDNEELTTQYNTTQYNRLKIKTEGRD